MSGLRKIWFAIMLALLLFMFFFSVSEYRAYVKAVISLKPASELLNDYVSIVDSDADITSQKWSQEGYMAVAELDWKNRGIDIYRQLAEKNPSIQEFYAGLTNIGLKLHFQGNEIFSKSRESIEKDLDAALNFQNSYFCYARAYFMMNDALVTSAGSSIPLKESNRENIVNLVRAGTIMNNCDTLLLQKRLALIGFLKHNGMPEFLAGSFLLKDKTTGEMLFRLSGALTMFAGQYAAENDTARAEEAYQLIIKMTSDVKKNCIDYATFRRCVMIEGAGYDNLAKYYAGTGNSERSEFYKNRRDSVKEILQKDDKVLEKLDLRQAGLLDANLSFANIAFTGNSMKLQSAAYEIFFGFSLVCMLIFVFIVSYIYSVIEKNSLNSQDFDYPQVKLSWGLKEMFLAHIPAVAVFVFYVLYSRHSAMRGYATDGKLAVMQAELLAVTAAGLTVFVVNILTGMFTKDEIRLKDPVYVKILKLLGGITILISAAVLYFMPAAGQQVVELPGPSWVLFYLVVTTGVTLLFAGYIAGHFSVPREMRLLKRFRSWVAVKSGILVLTVMMVVILILHLLVIQQHANSVKNSYQNEVLERALRNEVENTNLESLREW